MSTIKQAAAEFLANKRIAVTGVSRTDGEGAGKSDGKSDGKAGAGHGANIVYRRLRERGYEVFAVNPNADTVEGDTCYHDLKSIPGGVDAVVIGTRPSYADGTMEECAELGVCQVWMHRAFGGGSVSETAAELGRSKGITVIAGGCPLMFGATSDPGHKVIRAFGTLTGKVPRRV